MKDKLDRLAAFIAINPEVRGRNKHICISEFAIEYCMDDTINQNTVKDILSMDRSWRKVLEEHKELDYRVSTREAELRVKRELGYTV